VLGVRIIVCFCECCGSFGEWLFYRLCCCCYYYYYYYCSVLYLLIGGKCAWRVGDGICLLIDYFRQPL